MEPGAEGTGLGPEAERDLLLFVDRAIEFAHFLSCGIVKHVIG